jgi:hypothetical protein
MPESKRSDGHSIFFENEFERDSSVEKTGASNWGECQQEPKLNAIKTAK